MLGVRCFETMDSRACGEALIFAGTGEGALGGRCGGDWTFWLWSRDMCWLDCRSGSGALLVSRVCDTVVMWARSGRRNVGGSDERVSRRHCRAERAKRAMVSWCVQWVELLLAILFNAELQLKIVPMCTGHL